MDDHTMRLLAIAGLGIAGLTSVPGIFAIQSQIRNRTPKNNFYEDEDGVCSPEAMAAFSNTKTKYANVFFAAVTFGCYLAVAVLLTLDGNSHGEHWLQTWLTVGAWVSII